MEDSSCPGCGLILPSRELPAAVRYHASGECEDLLSELSSYTLILRDREFIHQEVVDAYAAQHATRATKPIRVFFALAGLYLFIDKGLKGKQVQRAHMTMADRKCELPLFERPAQPGMITVADVLRVDAGPDRDAAIGDWCRSVWHSWSHEHPRVATFTEAMLYEIR